MLRYTHTACLVLSLHETDSLQLYSHTDHLFHKTHVSVSRVKRLQSTIQILIYFYLFIYFTFVGPCIVIYFKQPQNFYDIYLMLYVQS